MHLSITFSNGPAQRVQGSARLFSERSRAGFSGASKAVAARVRRMMDGTLNWLKEHPLPSVNDIAGWGAWLAALPGDDVVPPFTNDLADILLALDKVVEEGIDLGRFLSQIRPLGADLAASRSQGVGFMTMGGSKGLTVNAVVVGGVDDQIVPRPGADLSEERRLLYVAMTRARKHAFCTWARKRFGPTARAGAPSVGKLRTYSSFLKGGPVVSQDGTTYLT